MTNFDYTTYWETWDGKKLTTDEVTNVWVKERYGNNGDGENIFDEVYKRAYLKAKANQKYSFYFVDMFTKRLDGCSE